jgi:hypothetical protein
MEFLGQTVSPFKEVKTKWEPIDLVYENEEKFCEATSKLINGFRDECKFVVSDKNGERHFVYVLDYRYISKYNTIRIYPENLRVVKN